jgi:hypothetical protein
MGDKMKSIAGGRMNVGVPEGYEIYEKEIPQKLKDSPDYNKYTWIGNFGFQEKSSGKKVTGDMPKSYEIQVEDKANKNLVYWDGKKVVKFTGTTEKKVGDKKFRSAKLKMGDPPIGWAN